MYWFYDIICRIFHYKQRVRNDWGDRPRVYCHICQTERDI